MADSVYKQIIDATVARIQALTMSGISTANIVARKTPIDRNLTKPCIIVYPVTERQPPNGGTNARDETIYGVGIVAIAAGNQDPTTNLERLLKWRQQIRLALHNHRLTGIAEVTGQQFIEPGPPVVENAFGQGWDVTVLTLRVGAWETRGITT